MARPKSIDSTSALLSPTTILSAQRRPHSTNSVYDARRYSFLPSPVMTSTQMTFPQTIWSPRRSIDKRSSAVSPIHQRASVRISASLGSGSSRILFYHRDDPHYGFTNFSSHSVIYNGKKYPTSEHLFQSFKFHEHKPGLAEHIRTCSQRPSVAFSEARRFQPEVRPDWKDVNITKMDLTLYLKFTQHSDLAQELLATGDAELVEDSDKDSFWGIGADGRGRNELGKALERLRAQLRGEGL